LQSDYKSMWRYVQTGIDEYLEQKVTATRDAQTLFHYTTEDRMKKIVDSQELYPSTKANNPKDAVYGDGQYLTDIQPGTKTQGQLA
jgi:hypothetical protein